MSKPLFIAILTSILIFKSNGLLAQDSIKVQIRPLAGKLYFLDCINGFGGGNVIASIGDDGILLVDDMYAMVAGRIDSALRTISPKQVRMVLNTHFHQDHIQGNKVYRKTAIIVGHENVAKRLTLNNKASAPTLDLIPAIGFSDSLSVNFNGEEIKMIHFADGHTDADAIVYFTKTKVLHLGDMFFEGMFPAVYTEGGGNIRNMVVSLGKIANMMPPDVIIIPGHGVPSRLPDLRKYIAMLNESIKLVDGAIAKGMTLEEAQSKKLLNKYAALEEGGAQTLDQFTAMLFKLLAVKK